MTVRQVEHRQRLLLFLGRLRREGSERCRGGDSGQTELCGRPWAHLECSLVLAGPLDTEVAQGILAALQVVLRFPRRLVVIGVGAWRDLPLDQVLDVLAAGEAHVRDGLDLEGRAGRRGGLRPPRPTASVGHGGRSRDAAAKAQRADLNQKAAGVVRPLLDRKMQRDEALQLS